MRWQTRVAMVAVVVSLCSAASAEHRVAAKGNKLLVHEWGTFTCLQDEQGRAIAGVNTDDEPIPLFVHRLANLINRADQAAPVYYKGIPRFHPQVTMRLETPVVYFYPPEKQPLPLHLDFRVEFQGGWLSEFYPHAQADAPGLERGSFRFLSLTEKTRSKLTWSHLALNDSVSLPATDMPVWLAPREVNSAPVKTESGEAEQYLFYRGVGHINAPVQVVRNPKQNELDIQVAQDFHSSEPLPVRDAWLVEIQDGGALAYRRLGPSELTIAGAPLYRTAATFDKAEFNTAHLDQLQKEMRVVLLDDGLFKDEADAMLKTWTNAYFKTPGLRLFFVLPKAWTDRVLPLSCSVPAEYSRTMVGRIEIVTPEQRQRLAVMDRTPVTNIDWFSSIQTGTTDGRMPPEYAAYISLGRFRNALVLDHAARNAKGHVAEFSRKYAITYYSPEETD